MLHILLLILKIIGILILCLLGALLLGIACMLFVPVRYRIEAVRKEGEGEPPVVLRVKVTWLLHFVNLIVRFDGSLFLRARIMVITLFRLPKKENRAKEDKGAAESGKKQEKAAKNRAKMHEGELVAAEDNRVKEGVTQTLPRETTSQTDTVQAQTTETPEGRPNESIENRLDESTEESADTTAEKPSFMDKLRALREILRGIFAKIKGLFENIQYTIQKFCDKIKSASDTIEYYRGVIEGEAFQRSFALCKDELLRIFKSLKPQKFQAKLAVGMDDPATTGEILAICGMLYPWIGGHVDVAGDFERKRLEGHVLVKGRIRFFTFLRVAVKIYFNRDIRKLYKLLKKEAV